MEDPPRLRDVVGRVDAGAPGIVRVEFPGRDRTVLAHTASHLDNPSRAEIRPRELLLTCPDQLDRLAGSLGKAGCLECRLAGVLAAITRTRIGHDHADPIRLHAKGPRQLAADAEGNLRARPDGELPFF